MYILERGFQFLFYFKRNNGMSVKYRQSSFERVHNVY